VRSGSFGCGQAGRMVTAVDCYDCSHCALADWLARSRRRLGNQWLSGCCASAAAAGPPRYAHPPAAARQALALISISAARTQASFFVFVACEAARSSNNFSPRGRPGCADVTNGDVTLWASAERQATMATPVNGTRTSLACAASPVLI